LIRACRQRRRKAWRIHLRILALPACVVAVALPSTAAAQGYTDLRSPDARDAAQAVEKRSAPVDPPPESIAPTVIHTSDDETQTLPIVLSSMALVVALAGIGVALGALHRRPRPRWTAR
jgi:hypothetical protein